MTNTPTAAPAASPEPGGITGYTLDQQLVVPTVSRRKRGGGAT